MNTVNTQGSFVSSSMSRVLSVQSHVVSGCVGNRAAVFPLQVLGFDVDFINSVHFSNHTGYPTLKGTVMTGDQLREVAAGLLANGLMDDYDYLLTGYIGSQTILDSVEELLLQIKANNPDVKYVCDPVLGDDDKLYVPETLIEVFKRKLISKAYMITPNQFEAELLSGVKIRSHNDACNALVLLHKMGPQTVVLTSSEIEELPGNLACYVLTAHGCRDGEASVHRFVLSKQDGHFTGTGDATAALMLAWTDILGAQHAGAAMLKTLSTMQRVIATTLENQNRLQGKFLATKAGSRPVEATQQQRARMSELCIVKSKVYIEEPPDATGIETQQYTIKVEFV